MSAPLIAPSAYRHGLTKEQILHAFEFPIQSYDVDDGMVMLIGGDRSGQFLELGVVAAGDGGPVIVPAMRARKTKVR